MDPLLSQASIFEVQTPRSSRQIHQIQRELRGVDDSYDNATLRQVFRKTGKALDVVIVEISTLKRERDQFYGLAVGHLQE